MGIIGELFDIAGDIVSLPFKIAGAAIECANDIGEAVEQDIRNKISGMPDEPTRTSYDVRNEADKIVDSARNDFCEARSELDTVWYNTSQEAIKVAEMRRNVYDLLGRATSTSLVELPSQQLRLLYPSNAPYVDVDFNIGTFVGAWGTNMRMEAAEDYLLKANEYRCEVGNLVNKVNSLRRTVLNISDAQEEELAMLGAIKNAYKVKTKNVLTESADLLRQIAELCVQEVGANTDSKYKELLYQLKRLWN